MTTKELLDQAEALKGKGNEHFSRGDAESAIAAYRRGIESVQTFLMGELTAELSAAASSLLAVLCSNCAHALTESGALEEAIEVARMAVSSDPLLKKGWLRLVRAQHLSRRSFEAFVGLHAHVTSGLSLRDIGTLCGPLSDTVAEAIGVSGLSTAFALVEDAAGGVSTVASDAIAEGKELFVERRWAHPLLAAASSTTSNVDNEAHLTHFSKQLVALLAGSKGGSASNSHSAQAWAEVSGALAGSWPRRLQDVPEHQQNIAAAVVERVLSSAAVPAEAAFSADEKRSVAHLALICRYNCFHSGFFRACALLNHSCLPNAAMKFVQRDQSVHMLVVSDIRKGDDITVKYLSDADYLEGVGRRRELLWNSWLFWCTCKRCREDDQPTSTCEFRKCSSSSCEGYVHCPTPGAEATTGDTMTPSERVCSACGTITRWTPEECDRVYKARTAAAQMEGDVAALSRQLVALGASVAALVHPDHWIHRVLLYYYGVKATQAVGHWFQGLQSEQLGLNAVTALALKDFVAPPDGGVDGGRRGGFLLLSLLDLWARIVPFYPWNEGWALHCAIVRLLVINLCAPHHPNAMGEDAAVEHLTRHAPFIGKQEQAVCLKLLVARRGADKAAAKLVKGLKRVFS